MVINMKEGKTAGIVTFSAADSFGALMQCYALRQKLEQAGYKTETIHYWPKYLRKDYRLMFNWEEFCSGIHSGWKCLWRSVVYIRFKNLPAAVSKYRKMECFRRRYLAVTKRCRTVKQLQKLEVKELYVAGSDQIWNPQLTGGKLDPVFFLNFVSGDAKRVSYAASTGATPSEEQALLYEPYLKTLERISVREARAAEVLEKTCRLAVTVDKDPTLLLSREEWEQLLLPKAEREKYIFFFSLYYTPEQFAYVNELSEKLDCPVRHYFYGRLSKRLKRNGGTMFFDDPRELLTKLVNASYIVSDSFHITVFSIIFQKDFMTFPSSKWSERMEQLLKDNHMEEHLWQKV